jgi:signal transduction histidine kinase
MSVVAEIATKHPVPQNEDIILIIDDDSSYIEVLVAYLEEYCFKTLVANNGEIGIKIAKFSQPYLILLDVMMSGIDGFETCRRLKADDSTKNIPVIFMTVLEKTEDKLKGFEVGGVDYITKPIHRKELLARITTHIRIRDLTLRLNAKIEKLTQTRHELVQNEKMATLGRLVAGVAHEINTPVGLSITAASTLDKETQIIKNEFNQGKLKRSALQAYLETAQQGSQLILSNLQQAAELVQSFKQVAVDQTHLARRQFTVKAYLEETILNLMPKLKQTKHRLTINGNDTVTINSYPGALSQVVNNLVTNSIAHAYQPGESGQLQFDISAHDSKLTIEYSDNGCGIAPENLSKIFEPFFTTARNQGGSGLGLHIVYNLITQKLKGTIRCESQVGKGTQFIIELPTQ